MEEEPIDTSTRVMSKDFVYNDTTFIKLPRMRIVRKIERREGESFIVEYGKERIRKSMGGTTSNQCLPL